MSFEFNLKMDPDPLNKGEHLEEEEVIEEILVEGNYVDEPEDLEEEEFEISNFGKTQWHEGLDKQTDRFDAIIGALQEIVIGSDFQK